MAAIVIALIFAIGIWLFWDIGWWKWFLLSFALLIGGWELASVLTIDLSLSQAFWEYHKAHGAGGWWRLAYLGAVLVVWLGHMGWKRYRRNK